MTGAVIVSAVRTPIGRAVKGSLAGERPDDMLAFAIATAVRRVSGLDLERIEATVPRYCASSLQAARMAFHAIRSDEGDAFVVGGVESISLVDREPRYPDDRHPRLAGQAAPLPDVYVPMGITAENVADRYSIGRDEMSLIQHAWVATARSHFRTDRTHQAATPQPAAAIWPHDCGARSSCSIDPLPTRGMWNGSNSG